MEENMRTPLLVAATSCLALSIGTATLAQDRTTPSAPPSGTTTQQAPSTAPSPSGVDSTAPSRSVDSPATTAPRAPTASTAPAAGTAGTMGVATLVGTDVKNSAGENIGEIKDIIVDASGKATSVILGTGGVLGLGSRNVPVNWDQIEISRTDSGKLEAMTALNKEQIEAMPEYTKDDGAWRPK
jgi:sporulation protein YlmC with PRC-barrel domain